MRKLFAVVLSAAVVAILTAAILAILAGPPEQHTNGLPQSTPTTQAAPTPSTAAELYPDVPTPDVGEARVLGATCSAFEDKSKSFEDIALGLVLEGHEAEEAGRLMTQAAVFVCPQHIDALKAWAASK